MSTAETRKRLRVAVIGAGAAGLVALRHLRDHPDTFEPVAFEQTAHVGGTWVYTDDVGTDSTTGLPVHSSMYRHLRVNIPKESMAFPDFPFDEELPSFMGHEDVRNYLKNYAQHFDLLPLIKFGHVVEHVRPMRDDDECSTVQWHVDVRQLHNHSVTSHVFDAVIVCNGHYTEPRMPETISLDKFEGLMLHSHDYRDPERFKDRRVLVLGAGPSGTDIVTEVAPFVGKIYLCHDDAPFSAESFPVNVQQCVGIDRMTSDAAILKNGERVEVDTLILCTGYRFAFPFLSDDCKPAILHDGQVVDDLYCHLIHAAFPTMSFVGIPMKVCPFPLFDRQVRFFLATLDGSVKLPSSEEMLDDARKEMEATVTAGKTPQHFHVFGKSQWDYNDKLATAAGCEPLKTVVAKIYEFAAEQRKTDMQRYRLQTFKILDPVTFMNWTDPYLEYLATKKQ